MAGKIWFQGSSAAFMAPTQPRKIATSANEINVHTIMNTNEFPCVVGDSSASGVNHSPPYGSATTASLSAMDPNNNSPEFKSSLNPTGSEGKEIMNSIFKILKFIIVLFFPSWTFTKFFINAIVPTLADNLVPLFFLGNIVQESALALAGQFTFIEVIVEVIEEGIVNSLFYYVGRNYTTNRLKALQALKICLTVLVCLGGVLTTVMIPLVPYFVDFIDTPASIADATQRYLYISSFSFPLFLVGVCLSNFLLITTSKYLIAAQVCNVTLSFLFNFFLFGQQSLSLHWGVDQLGFYKIIQSAQNCMVNFAFCLLIEKLGPLEFLFKVPLTRHLRSNFKELFHVSWGNFGESAVANFFYFMVTLKFINNLGVDESAAWNLLNSIVWGLLLIPAFTVANYAKVRIGHQGMKHVIRQVAKESFKCLICWLTLVSILSFIFWSDLAKFFGKSNEQAQALSTKLLYEMGWIFIIFSFNIAMDSLFFGTGKTKYVFYQGLFTNMAVYFVPWILFEVRVITPTYWWVVSLYIGGMLVDFCLTSYFCVRVWKSLADV